MQVGLIVIDENPLTALDVAREADRRGIHSIWTIDYYNRSSLSRAAMMAVATEQSLIGTSITPLFARAPLALASAVSDIQNAANGRFVLGVGSSTRRMNADWYGTPMERPASQVAERIAAVRSLLAHKSGPYAFDGRFDHLTMAHFDRAAVPPVPKILAAAVGTQMMRVAGRVADGFVGHPIASAEFLRDSARPQLEAARAAAGRDVPLCITTQVVAACGDNPDAARRAAALQVGFYSTVRGYDALFPDDSNADERLAAREAFRQGDAAAVGRAVEPFVSERAVFGRMEDITSQLSRYRDAIDWVLLYPPHYGVEAAEITANERALIEVAACWTS